MQQVYRRAPMPKCDFNKCSAPIIKKMQNMLLMGDYDQMQLPEEVFWKKSAPKNFFRIFLEHLFYRTPPVAAAASACSFYILVFE